MHFYAYVHHLLYFRIISSSFHFFSFFSPNRKCVMLSGLTVFSIIFASTTKEKEVEKVKKTFNGIKKENLFSVVCVLLPESAQKWHSVIQFEIPIAICKYRRARLASFPFSCYLRRYDKRSWDYQSCCWCACCCCCEIFLTISLFGRFLK